jgi:hypothetical protein
LAVRLLAALFFVSLVAPALGATAMTDRLVDLLDRVCAAPATPEGMIEAGNQAAMAEGWKLVVAGAAPLPFLHNENGPKISFQSVWELDLTPELPATLAVSIVRPEQPGLKYSVCMIQPKAGVAVEDVAGSMNEKFGTRIARDARRSRSDSWLFAHERSRGNCGRRISLLGVATSRHNPQTLMLIDVAFPAGGDWKALADEFACRP